MNVQARTFKTYGKRSKRTILQPQSQVQLPVETRPFLPSPPISLQTVHTQKPPIKVQNVKTTPKKAPLRLSNSSSFCFEPRQKAKKVVTISDSSDSEHDENSLPAHQQLDLSPKHVTSLSTALSPEHASFISHAHAYSHCVTPFKLPLSPILSSARGTVGSTSFVVSTPITCRLIVDIPDDLVNTYITCKAVLDTVEKVHLEAKESLHELSLEMGKLAITSSDPGLQKLLDFGSVGDRSVLQFDDLVNKLLSDSHASLKKMGEATFSEVFILNESPAFQSDVVLKIVPFTVLNSTQDKEFPQMNGGPMTQLVDILHEMELTSELSKFSKSICENADIRQAKFVGFLKSQVVRGKFPLKLLKLWDAYDEEFESESDRPDYFDDDQLYCVLYLTHGGIDLEHWLAEMSVGKKKTPTWTMDQAIDIIVQLGHALAQAETNCQFEHRDLHWGNVLLSSSRNSDLMQCTIIDYTFSRINVKGNNRTLFRAYEDEDYFTGKGDYQFEVYRMMKQELDDDWSLFNPKTNVFWIHYIAHQFLLAAGRIKITSNTKGPGKLKVKPKTKYDSRLEDFYCSVLDDYNSVSDMIIQDPLFQQ